MIYLSIVTIVVLSVMCISYKVGRAVGEINSTDERHQLRTANARLMAQVDLAGAKEDASRSSTRGNCDAIFWLSQEGAVLSKKANGFEWCETHKRWDYCHCVRAL